MTYFEETSDNSSDSDSEFDEDDDPDKIEVPGGGKDLYTAVNTVIAHKDGAAPVIKDDPDKASSSTMQSSETAQSTPTGSAAPFVPKGGVSLLKTENPGPLGNPNEIKIKREVPIKISSGMNLPGGKVAATVPTKGAGPMFDHLRMSGGPNMSPFSNSNVMNNFYAGAIPGVPSNLQGAVFPPNLLGNQGRLTIPESFHQNLSGVQMSQILQSMGYGNLANSMGMPGQFNPYMNPMMSQAWVNPVTNKGMMPFWPGTDLKSAAVRGFVWKANDFRKSYKRPHTVRHPLGGIIELT